MYKIERDCERRFVCSVVVVNGAVALLLDVGSSVFAIDACHVYLPYFDHVLIVIAGRLSLTKNLPFVFALVPAENEEHYRWVMQSAKEITTTAEGECLFDQLMNQHHVGVWCDMQKGLEKVSARAPPSHTYP